MLAKRVTDECGALTKQNEHRLQLAVRQISQGAHLIDENRRDAERIPFICPALLSLDDENSLYMPVYIRDISEQGIGFMHGTPIDLREVTATFMPAGGSEIRLRVRLRWCKEFGNWFLSGGEFLYVES